jgi:hypothetical protein
VAKIETAENRVRVVPLDGTVPLGFYVETTLFYSPALPEGLGVTVHCEGPGIKCRHRSPLIRWVDQCEVDVPNTSALPICGRSHR